MNICRGSRFQEAWRRVKANNKTRLAKIIELRTGITVDPATLFDIQVKRIHEYKRQHLNVLHIIALYLRIKYDLAFSMAPRTFIFGGKAAPGYFIAKLIIKLINAVGELINGDPEVRDLIKVVFLPDFNVKHGQNIYPSADLSEQISTAGKEASGTGNMKFSMNGALTIGTLDGANIEIREEVGPENFFLFGLTADQVANLKAEGYNPQDYYHRDAELKSVIDVINSGLFAHGDTELFRPLTDHLLYHDDYLLMADYRAYVDRQEEVNRAFQDSAHWTRMSISILREWENSPPTGRLTTMHARFGTSPASRRIQYLSGLPPLLLVAHPFSRSPKWWPVLSYLHTYCLAYFC